MEIFKRLKTEEARGNGTLAQTLLQMETNLWACIYRICDYNRDRRATKKLMDSEPKVCQSH